jgi:hypothetical protein
MSDQPMTQDDCNRLRLECPTREAVYGKDGIKDEMKEMRKETDAFRDEMREAMYKIDKRLSRIEWGFLFAAGAWTFFSQVLPALIKIGQAATATH